MSSHSPRSGGRRWRWRWPRSGLSRSRRESFEPHRELGDLFMRRDNRIKIPSQPSSDRWKPVWICCPASLELVVFNGYNELFRVCGTAQPKPKLAQVWFTNAIINYVTINIYEDELCKLVAKWQFQIKEWFVDDLSSLEMSSSGPTPTPNGFREIPINNISLSIYFKANALSLCLPGEICKSVYRLLHCF